MGGGPEQTPFRGGYTDGQQIHEKMLNNTSYKENANQNHNEIPPHNYQNGYYQ